MDVFRQKRLPGSASSVDAHTCYDRIAHSIASICAQRLAVAIETIICLLMTIILMHFYLRTAFGDSLTFYRGVGGICQGNGGGPAMWLSVSIVLVENMRRQGYISIFVRVVMGLKVCFIGFLFVDDM
jgi:hypothetical protein